MQASFNFTNSQGFAYEAQAVRDCLLKGEIQIINMFTKHWMLNVQTEETQSYTLNMQLILISCPQFLCSWPSVKRCNSDYKHVHKTVNAKCSN